MGRAWDDTFSSGHGHVVELVGQHRQVGEDSLRAVLSRLRVGECRAEDLALLNATWVDQREEWPEYQHLCSRSCDAQAYNAKQLAAIVGASATFYCRDEVPPTADSNPPNLAPPPNLNKVAASVVTLKVGAKVVCTMSFGVVRTGTHGVVVAFVQEVSVSCKFEGVEDAVEMPMVKFSVMDEEERELGCRWQVPVILSWAVTISRSQGMTIHRVAVDFSCTRWTLDGMVYAALSRAVSLLCLRVHGLTEEHVKTSGNALHWYEKVRSERLFRAM